MDTWTDSSVVSTGFRGKEILPSVTAALLHYNVMDLWTLSNVVNTV